MVNQTQKRQMRDYLVDRLRDSHGAAEPMKREIVLGTGDIDYIAVGGEEKVGAVLLVNKYFTNDKLARIYNGARTQHPNVGMVFFKDGKTFFRSAAAGEDANGIKSKASKLANDRSMKNYTIEDFHKMISPRPEEKVALRNKKWIQYFQPESERLEEGLVSYRFQPVRLDYSHIPSGERFGPLAADSKTTYIWIDKHEHGDKLHLEGGLVKTKTE